MMQSRQYTSVLAACAAVLLPVASLGGEPSTSSNAAVALVRQALQAELDGADRTSLLQEALALDPNCDTARWQLGYVRIGDAWVKVDDVPVQAADDETLAAYRKRRDALVDTADNQRELARWCRQHKLPAEARVHWAKLAEFEPQDAEALSALGLEWYAGRLMTALANRGGAATGRRGGRPFGTGILARSNGAGPFWARTNGRPKKRLPS